MVNRLGLAEAFALVILTGTLASATDRFVDAVQIPLGENRWCPASPLSLNEGDALGPPDMARPVEGPASFITDLRAIRLNISFDGVECDDGCRDDVSRILAQSMNLWRHLCLRCGTGLMAFVVEADHVYLDHDVYVAWRDAPEGFSQGLLAATAPFYLLDGSTPAAGTHVVGTYVRVSKDSPVLQELCERDLRAFKNEWPAALKMALCDQSSATPSLNIAFANRPACGKVSLIGCGSPETEIQINTQRFRYEETDGQSGSVAHFIIGDPNSPLGIDVHAALLHEIGHFLGIDHLPMADLPATNVVPVMRQTYDAGFCVSTTDARMLNNVAEKDWKFRAKECSGLEGP